MKEAIEKALGQLLGQPLWAIGRAADVVWFQFGEKRIVANQRGHIKAVGAYALHLQCPWSWTRSWGEVIVTQDDSELTELLRTPLLCTNIEVGNNGSFRILFDDQTRVIVEPDLDHETEEHWRLFQPLMERPHFIVSPKELEA